MSTIFEVKDTIIEAKKKYDKDKYIEVLEQQIKILEQEIDRLNTRLNKLESNTFKLNSDHLKLFEIFKENDYKCDEEKIKAFAKGDIDLEIALSELIDNNYFEYPSLCVIGSPIKLFISENKKIKFLQALKAKKDIL